MYDPQPISDRPVRLVFPHRAGRFRPWGSPFSPPGCRSCRYMEGRYMEGFMIREWDPIVPGWRWLHSRAPVNQRSAGGVGVSTPYGAISTRGSPFSSPYCLSCKCMNGFSEPRTGTYPPRVRRSRWISPRRNSRRADLAPSLAKGGRRGRLGQWEMGSKKRWDESHLPIILKYIYTAGGPVIRRPINSDKRHGVALWP